MEVADLHIPLATALRLLVRPDVLWWHVPNGEPRTSGQPPSSRRWASFLASVTPEFHWAMADGMGRKLRKVLHLELKVEDRSRVPRRRRSCLAMRCLGDLYYVAHWLTR